MKKNNKTISLKDVSTYSKLSLITVSRTLNQPNLVSLKTKKIVYNAIEVLGYVPNLNARTLVKRNSNIVGLVVPQLRSSLFADLAEGLENQLSKSGLNLLLAVSNRSQKQETKAVKTFVGRQADAIVLTGIWHNKECTSLLKSFNGPVIETCNLKKDPIDLNVGFNNYEASVKMTKYLIDCGNQSIAVVGNDFQGSDQSSDRLKGFLHTMKNYNIPTPKKLILDLEFNDPIKNGYDSLINLMSLSNPPRAIFYLNELFAHGALMACNFKNILVPDAISIAGFGDLNISKYLPVPLTTINIDYTKIGYVSGKYINNSLNQLNQNNNVLDVGSDLKIRKSTKSLI